MIDSVFWTGKSYYLQVFLEECKYVAKKRIPKYITDNIEISSASDEENSDEEILKKIQMEKFLLWRKCWWRNSDEEEEIWWRILNFFTKI